MSSLFAFFLRANRFNVMSTRDSQRTTTYPGYYCHLAQEDSDDEFYEVDRVVAKRVVEVSLRLIIFMHACTFI